MNASLSAQNDNCLTSIKAQSIAPIRGTQFNTPSETPHSSNIRYRSRTGLKPCDPNRSASFLFPYEEARFDRIQMTIAFSGRCPNQEDFQQLIYTLASVVGISADQRPLFSRDETIASNRYRLRIKDGWLFKGAGKRDLNTVEYQNGRVRFHFTLALNLTRFLAHQDSEDLGYLRALSPDDALQARDCSTRLRGLDGNDNILTVKRMGGRSFDNRDAHTRAALEIYMGHIMALFQERIGEIHPEILHDVTPIVFRAIQQAEVYWELESEDAITVVTALGRSCTSSAAHIFKTFPVTVGIAQNCPSIRIPLNSDVHLVIYAKESRRVRFEVKFSGPIRQLADRSKHSTDRTPYQDLLALRSDASNRMQRVWRALSLTLRDSNPSPGKLSDFLELLNRADLGGEKT